jgi:hypothetical protein
MRECHGATEKSPIYDFPCIRGKIQNDTLPLLGKDGD